jgi:glucosamine-6-phosphate deaminase
VIVKVFESKRRLSEAAAEQAAAILRSAIGQRGNARLIAATGNSQLDFLAALVALPEIDWARVELFHLDEYVGLPLTHPASFRKYLLENFIRKAGITNYHLLDGEGDVQDVIRRASAEIQSAPIDVAFVGFGENAHLAFNEPPANFETDAPYLIVDLDEITRKQQVGEGWFANPADVPAQAISMSVRQILRSQQIITVVPDARKAQAVKACLEGEVTPMAPGSILRTHPATTVYLDRDSAGLLSPTTLAKFATAS